MKSPTLHRWLLRALPRATRIAAEEELSMLFAERLARATRRGPLTVAALWITECADIARTAVAERRGPKSRVASARPSALAAWARDAAWSVRHLTRAPRAIGLSVVILAVGLAASTTAFVLVRDVLVRPLPFRDPDRLVRLVELDKNRRAWWPSFPNCADWRRVATSVFDDVGCASPEKPKAVILGRSAVKATVAEASAGLFDALGARPVVGRLFTHDEHRPGGPPAAIVSRRFWQHALNARPLEELTFVIGDSAARVVGVMPESFSFLGDAGTWVSPDVWTPLEQNRGAGGRGSHGYHTVGRLRPGVSIERATTEMARLSKLLIEEHHENTQADSVGIRPLKEYVTRNAAAPLRILSWAAAAVLLVSCFNFGATLLARGLDRQRELRMRLALGATRGDLLRLAVADAAALAVPAALLSVAMAACCLAWMRTAAADALPRMADVALDWSAIGAALVAAVIAAVGASLAPALALSSRALSHGLGSRGTVGASPSAQRVWSALLAAQVTVTLLLLAQTGLLLRSFVAATTVDLGFRADDVAAVELAVPPTVFSTDDARLAYFRQVAERLRRIPGVDAVGLTSALAIDTQSMAGSTSIAGQPPPSGYIAALRLVDGDYFHTMGIPLRASANALVPGLTYIDDAVARKLWSTQSPLGGELSNSFAGITMQVAGVVGTTRQWDDAGEGPGVVYAPLGTAPGVPNTMHAVVHFSGASRTALRSVKEAVASVNPLVPADPRWLSSLAAGALQSRRLIVVVAMSFAVMAFLLACAGTYAMVLFAVRRRLREAAIRLALGAAARDVRARFVRIGVMPSLAGLAVGAALAKPAGALVASQLFHVRPGDPAVLGAALATLAGAALLAALVPARRAARVDPVTLLRDE